MNNFIPLTLGAYGEGEIGFSWAEQMEAGRNVLQWGTIAQLMKLRKSIIRELCREQRLPAKGTKRLMVNSLIGQVSWSRSGGHSSKPLGF